MQYCKTRVELQNQIFIVSVHIFDTQVILFQYLDLCIPKMYQTNRTYLTRTLKHQEPCFLSIRVTSPASETAKTLHPTPWNPSSSFSFKQIVTIQLIPLIYFLVKFGNEWTTQQGTLVTLRSKQRKDSRFANWRTIHKTYLFMPCCSYETYKWNTKNWKYTVIQNNCAFLRNECVPLASFWEFTRRNIL